MDFNRRNVIKTLRNGQIVSTSSNVTSLATSQPSVLTGNYLPATSNGDGTYLVDLSKVQFTGSIVAYGEVTAYGSGESGGSNTVGNVTIYDGLDSTDPAVALSANQGRILKELIDEGGGSIEKLTDVELVNLADGQILKYDAAKGHWVNGDGTKVTWENIEGKPEGLTDEKLQQIIDFKADDYLLKSVWDSVFTIDSSGNLRVKTNLVGEQGVSAYGVGNYSGGGGTGVTVYDGLDSIATDVALSANQGRVLKDLIANVDLSDYYTKDQVEDLLDSIKSEDIDLSDYYKKPEVNNLLTNYAKTTDLNNHTKDTTKHITSTERTNWNTAYQSYHTHSNKSVLDGITTTLISNWNTAYTNNHTHSNKSVLDGITSTKVANWDGVVTNWNKVFTIDSNGDLKVKVNVIGEKEISAYGAGTSSGGSSGVDIVDALTSTRTDAALSANQGRYLKSLIDNIDVGNVDLSNYYTKTQVDDLIDDVNPTWSNISGKPTFATVATSGSYNDLSNKPTIPTNTNQLTNGAGYITGITKSMVTTALGYTPPTTNTTYSAGTGLKLSGTTFSADGSAIINSLTEGKSPAERTDYIVAQYAGGGTTTTSYHRRSLANVFAALTKSDITTALGYTPPTTNTTYSAGTGLSLSGTSFSVKYGTAAGTACQGNDSRLSNARPASDVYSWAKASSKPSYSWSEITSKPTSMPASDVYSWAKASSKPSYSWSEIGSKPSFATVATSGKYSDLSGRPTIPTNTNQLTNGAGYITSSGSISGNAATATKLANSRTLWGQSFNGTANVSGNMTGVGSISCTSVSASGEVTAHSDKRLKSNIKPLEVRGELNPVTYVKDGKESIGFIADEVKEVYPELVITDESTDEKYLSLNYQQLTAVLYAEIKELKNQIKELNEKVRTMAN